MAANFAPYQDSPEASRALSPPPQGVSSPRLTSPRTSLDRTRNIGTSSLTSPPTRAYEQHDYFQGQPHQEEPEVERVAWNAVPSTSRSGFGRPREDVDMFTTSLGWRLDYEACLAYLLLPPAGGVLLLVLEHQSDYVRFHAWQSSLLFAFAFVIHIIFSWSSFISWVLLIGDIAGIGWLTYRAYLDAATLDRYEVPFFGPLASSILDDE
ncbi:Nn.00g090040.m01.CDS01 [Neocucurbitaria sp. VM-36]